MNRCMIDEYHRDPVLLRSRLSSQAHLERARAVGEAMAWLFSAIGRVFGYAKARLTARPTRWIARLG